MIIRIKMTDNDQEVSNRPKSLILLSKHVREMLTFCGHLVTSLFWGPCLCIIIVRNRQCLSGLQV